MQWKGGSGRLSWMLKTRPIQVRATTLGEYTWQQIAEVQFAKQSRTVIRSFGLLKVLSVHKKINLLTMQGHLHKPGLIFTIRTHEVITVVLIWQILINVRLRQLKTAVVIPLTTAITSNHCLLFIIWLSTYAVEYILCSQTLPHIQKTTFIQT
jgi:hypothetical protein